MMSIQLAWTPETLKKIKARKNAQYKKGVENISIYNKNVDINFREDDVFLE